MSTETPVPQGSAEPERTGWRDWLAVLAVALFLLVLSEALWLWQTWSVRELLQGAPTSTRPAVPQ